MGNLLKLFLIFLWMNTPLILLYYCMCVHDHSSWYFGRSCNADVLSRFLYSGIDMNTALVNWIEKVVPLTVINIIRGFWFSINSVDLPFPLNWTAMQQRISRRTPHIFSCLKFRPLGIRKYGRRGQIGVWTSTKSMLLIQMSIYM